MPLSLLSRFLARDLAIDLGTANTLVYARGADLERLVVVVAADFTLRHVLTSVPSAVHFQYRRCPATPRSAGHRFGLDAGPRISV